MAANGAWWLRRRRSEQVEAVEEKSQPIDTQEQEEMVGSLEKKHAQQSRIWRSVFAGFLFGYIGLLLYSVYMQAWFPWELRYHAYFMEEMSSWMVIFAGGESTLGLVQNSFFSMLTDWVAIIACLLTIMGLLSKSHRKWTWYSCYVGLLLSVFWFFYMLRLPRFRWDALWLPLGPISGSVVCLYVDHLLLESLEDVRQLRGYMYNFKAL